jgi:hypothetical protein
MLKQFTSFATTQLESCNMPPSKLMTDFILSAIPDPKKCNACLNPCTFILDIVHIFNALLLLEQLRSYF